MATDYLINKPPETKAKNEKKTQEAKEKTREMLKKEARRIKKAYEVALDMLYNYIITGEEQKFIKPQMD